MSLTICCVWVQGNAPYTAEYVTRLRAGVSRSLHRPHRFVCLTDHVSKLSPDIDGYEIPSANPLPGWWAKVRLFDPAIKLSGRVLYLDLDTLIVANLEPIVDYPSRFALVPHAGTFEGRDGLAVVKRFNSSVMVWDAGVNESLFTSWRRSVGDRLWGDQDWIGEQYPHADTMPAEWFPRLSAIGAAGHIPDQAKVVLAKKPKPEQAARQWPWFRERWRVA